MADRRRSRPRPDAVAQVPFQRRKYGRELLVDAARLSDLPAFVPTPRPHTLRFFDILLVTRGRGTLWIDEVAHTVRPGVVLFTRPGQVRRWRVRHLDGACVFFTAEFVREAFSDPGVLDTLSYFRPGRPSGGLPMRAADRREFLRRFDAMRREIQDLPGDASLVLRAVLYELLVRLDRWYVARHGAAQAGPDHRAVARFMALVERDVTHRHRVADYAEVLGLSPGHLGVLCRDHVGLSPGAVIRRRLMLEARRRLRYTSTPVFAVARELGFADAAYFGRFFRRESGTTPRRYRTARP